MIWPLFLIILGVFAIVALARLGDAQKWNKGRCPDCGNPWKSFDMDSSGAIGYNCRNDFSKGCVNPKYIWVSWLSKKELECLK